MLPQSQPRKKRNSSKVNLLISFVFHAALLAVLLYFAARSGILGNQIKKIAVQMIKEKAPPKPKPPPPHVEPPKITPKIVPKIAEPVAKAAPPPSAAPVVAPPAPTLPSFDFGGGRAVETSSDPVQLYKGALEYAFHSKWDRPDNMDDEKYEVDVQVSVDRDGNISNPQWEKESGNSVWDQSVRKAISAVTSMGRPPPTNFPQQITVRFDVQDEAADDSSSTLMQ
ncbi:MAG TPA: TonB C-terminal domain-containing protein [Candidatus Acidoferrales bacterium]|jgi:TonB family protein|nr:TonB C-terminal domain-containing protein [Candidatus Acidoferrales bacterium]